MNSFHYYRRLATDKNTLRRSLRVSLIVGLLLNLINNPSLFSSISFENLKPLKLVLTFIVPFCVSAYSSVLSNSKLKPGTVSQMKARLNCTHCSVESLEVKIGQIINNCPRCGEKTHWKPSEIYALLSSKEELLKNIANKKMKPGYPSISIKANEHIPLDKFKEMDYHAVETYHLPIELMMENAGLQLARLASAFLSEKGIILFGIGTGNNGGGGLVAARRLKAWGYKVYIHLAGNNLNPLAEQQLTRALSFGVEVGYPENPDIFVEAYLGFSQRLPLSESYKEAVDASNNLNCKKISLDLPAGFDKLSGNSIFRPDIILTLAAMKSELLKYDSRTDFYLADLGIPSEVYRKFGILQPKAFRKEGLLCINPIEVNN